VRFPGAAAKAYGSGKFKEDGMRRIDAPTLHGWITDGGELALLDAREEGEFGASHLFWAVPCPFSKRELRAPGLLPRRGTRVVVCDDGRGVAEKLAEYLESIGCGDVSVLDGGTGAWAAAGYVLFSGVNVPSKAFGEWVEHHFGTESVDAPELNAWLNDGRDMVVLDSRTVEEFRRMSIPKGRSMPGGELAYRIADLVPDPATLIVVNCAGRTRSILGAESLRQAGVPNRVVALRNGTMGWELAGLVPDRGQAAEFSPGVPRTAGLAMQRAAGFADRSGVRVIDAAGLAALEADGSRTLYVLDVRDPVEFRAGSRAGAISAPGGQLVQATDSWVGVRGARIALIDDDGVRARMSASWLRQMGHGEVFVAEGALGDVVPAAAAAPAGVGAEAVEGATVVDLARSIDFREGHIPGAIWGVRGRLDGLAARLAGAARVVVTSPDGVLAALAVDELRGLTAAPVSVLAGGTEAWRAAGRPMARDRTVPADGDCIDFYLRPYDRNSGVEDAMQAYLSWEIDLVHEIARDGTVRFGV
jgi:rhodanese-related sulfurtransferase